MDITMCQSVACPLASGCHRSPQSGTKPCEFRQSWFVRTDFWENVGTETRCDHYWPTVRRAETAGVEEVAL